MKKILLILLVATIALAILVVRWMESRKIQNGNTAAVQAALDSIQSIAAGELEFVIKSNPVNDLAPIAIASDRAIGKVQDTDIQTSPADEDIRQLIMRFIGSMALSAVNERETLVPGTPPASVSFYLDSEDKAYTLHLYPDHAEYITVRNGAFVVGVFSIDNEASAALLQAVGFQGS